jgi:uncharacterized protein (TIGR01568 family)
LLPGRAAMRWGLRSSCKQRHKESLQPLEQESKGKSKASFSSFLPLAWLAKLTARNGVPATKVVHATSSAAKNTAQAATAFPSCFHKPASPSTASASRSSLSLASSSSSAADAEAAGIVPCRRDDATGGDTVAGIAPRRRSVGNDDARTEAATATARQLYHSRRHYSVGGDRDLPHLGHLVSLSPNPKAAPPTPAPVRTLPPLPSDSDTDEEKRTTARNRRRRRRRAVSGRRSFSSAKATVRVRSPRPPAAAVSELERFAVVRRTRDPHRAFRASMVEMIASKRMVGRPDELETLLACYLSLNADEHHDCIVKVFRQVWFELNNASRATATAPPQRTAHLSG